MPASDMIVLRRNSGWWKAWKKQILQKTTSSTWTMRVSLLGVNVRTVARQEQGGSSILGSAGEDCKEDDEAEEADMNELFEDNGTNQCSIIFMKKKKTCVKTA